MHACFGLFPKIFSSWCSSGTKNQSFQSLEELDLNAPGTPIETITQSASRDQLKTKTVSAGRAEYIGICLPVDVNMIFHVSREGEDKSADSAALCPIEPELPPPVPSGK